MVPSQSDIAAALQIDKSLVTRYRKRGMPVDSIEAARAWKREHVRPRITIAPPPDASPPSAQRHAAQTLADHAGELLAAGSDVAALVPSLRLALAAVSEHERADVGLSRELWDVLVERVLTLVPNEDSGEPMSPADEEALGDFWYRVAAGEVVPVVEVKL
ncbi:MAG TPA: hypothetical protein PKE15_00340 [Ottowia sp.]|nr:hypothetical protein [Ottowia sp.]